MASLSTGNGWYIRDNIAYYKRSDNVGIFRYRIGIRCVYRIEFEPPRPNLQRLTVIQAMIYLMGHFLIQWNDCYTLTEMFKNEIIDERKEEQH